MDVPGTNVAAKSGLNKSILDQGWGEFARQLAYKQKWRGGTVLKVPPQYTSRTCSICGHEAKENRKTQEQFTCINCGHTENADINAAKNILAAGLAAQACGGDGVSRPVKQEPAEAA
jgi:putative transposase